MKRKLLPLILLLLPQLLIAKISVQTQQILVPKRVYIGDTAELRVSFSTSQPIMANEVAVRELSLSDFDEGLDHQSYEIKKISLMHSGVNNYSLIFTLIPWKTGYIQLPSYNVKALDDSLEGCLVKFEPFTISSLTENADLSLRTNEAPLLLPGTSYKLYACLIFVLVVMILSIQLIVRRKSVELFLKNRKLLRLYKKNRKTAVKELNRLLKNEEISDQNFAEKIQQILRKYMEVRFGYAFTKTVSSEIFSSFSKVTAGLASEEKNDAAMEMQRIFIRTDFIRYGHNDFQNLNDEKKTIVETIKQKIEVLEAQNAQNA